MDLFEWKICFLLISLQDKRRLVVYFPEKTVVIMQNNRFLGLIIDSGVAVVIWVIIWDSPFSLAFFSYFLDLFE